MSKSLHDTSVTRLAVATWRKSTHSGQLGNCVEAASLDGGEVALRNSRYPSGPTLIFSRDEMAVFLAGAKEGEFDDVASWSRPPTPGDGYVTRGEVHGPGNLSPLTTWFTCESDRTNHSISDSTMAVGFSVGASRYVVSATSRSMVLVGVGG